MIELDLFIVQAVSFSWGRQYFACSDGLLILGAWPRESAELYTSLLAD